VADRLIDELASLTGANTASGDKFIILDVSDNTDDPTGTAKEITRAELLNALATAAAQTLLDDASVADIATTLGLGTGNSPQLAGVNLGHASDTTLTRDAAGVLAVEGAIIQTTAWTSWTPSLSVGFADGNATCAGKYVRVGRTIIFYASIIMGSTTTYGTTLGASLPVTPADMQAAATSSRGIARIVATAYFHMAGFNSGGSHALRPYRINAAGAGNEYASATGVTSTVPATWTTGDELYYWGAYEASS
jgi:hypothetical protein